MNYFDQKAADLADALGITFTDGDRSTVVTLLKMVARDQRHACAEAVMDPARYSRGIADEATSAAYAAAFNARIA